jgi:hypothetical protein
MLASTYDTLAHGADFVRQHWSIMTLAGVAAVSADGLAAEAKTAALMPVFERN